MCGPAALPILMIASTAMAAIGTGVTAIQTAAQNRYQAKIADRNADLANEAARDSIDRGKIEAQQQGRKLSQLKGAQQAAMAANGIDTSFGSAAHVAEETAMFGAEDMNATYQNSLRETRGLEINASNFTAEARAKRQAAKGALVEGAFGVANTLLGGATQYSKMKAKQGGAI